MEKNILKLICAAVVLVPLASLCQMPGTILWYPQYIALIVLGFVLASMLIWKQHKPLALLSFYCTYSFIFVCHTHPRSLLCLVAAYAGIGLICMVSNIENTKNIYRSIMAVAVLQFILVILQKFNADPFFHTLGNEKTCDTVGFLGSHNQLGIYSASLMPIFLNVFSVLLIVPLIMTQCSSAVLGGIVASCFVLGFKSRVAAVTVLILSIFLSTAWLKYDSSAGNALQERMKIWELSVTQLFQGKAVMEVSEGVKHIVTCNPLTGFGLGGFIMVSPATQRETLRQIPGYDVKNHHRYEHAHNDFIEWLFEGGILGTILGLMCAASVLATFFGSPKTPMVLATFGSILAVAISSLGTYVIHAPVSYFMLCLMLGLFYAEVKNARISIQKA